MSTDLVVRARQARLQRLAQRSRRHDAAIAGARGGVETKHGAAVGPRHDEKVVVAARIGEAPALQLSRKDREPFVGALLVAVEERGTVALLDLDLGARALRRVALPAGSPQERDPRNLMGVVRNLDGDECSLVAALVDFAFATLPRNAVNGAFNIVFWHVSCPCFIDSQRFTRNC